ncbi:hypothetical protein QF034_008139 [Streptomyces africanus]|uniref:Uncharacterized protein n=1 Tax=Streptomyces africanus TaxID=231024 RepID=A0ABU0R2L1_9ACTN|nr:hypothetical protein [Streptomyces africanus]
MVRLRRVHQERMAQEDVARGPGSEGEWPVVDAATRSGARASSLAPSSPYFSNTFGTSRCEPTRIRVGASSSPTSLNRNSISNARPGERRLVKYPLSPSGG